MNERNEDGFTLPGFIRAVRRLAVENHSLLNVNGWRSDWTGICDDHWRFGFIPAQALEAIEAREHLT